MARMPPVFTSETTAAPPWVYSEGRPAMPSARARSVTSWRRISRVRETLSPGLGSSSSPVSWSVSQVSLTTLPVVLVSMARLPASPRRYSSNASSTPSVPTVSSMLYPRASYFSQSSAGMERTRPRRWAA